ncbi:hypothetical protein ACVBEQ_17025 [Nakamurella sp. GG22]
MTPNVVPKRRPAGTSAGGQFAPTARSETRVAVSAPGGSPSLSAGGGDGPTPVGHPECAAPTGTLSGVHPAARAALLDESAPTVTDPEGRYPVVIGPRFESDPRRPLPRSPGYCGRT